MTFIRELTCATRVLRRTYLLLLLTYSGLRKPKGVNPYEYDFAADSYRTVVYAPSQLTLSPSPGRRQVTASSAWNDLFKTTHAIQ